MIKTSALLVALAIGLLVAGVVASSLLMVYVSIGVCAVAALLLAAGVLSHWSEIFGRGEARPASPAAWSEPQVNITAPVLASIQAVAAAQGSGRPGREEAGLPPGARADGGRTVGGRPSEARADGGRAPERPAEVVPSPAEAAGRGGESAAPRRNDDLWERVEEELGSAAKRDTGALSWPGTVFPPVPPDLPEPAESAAPAPEAGPQSEPRVGAGAWLWGSGAGWQPPETADPAWPPPAAAFAEPKAAPESAEPEHPAAQESASPELAEPEPAAPESGGPEDPAGPPVPDEPAADAEVAQDAAAAEDAEAALDEDAVPGEDAVPAEDAAPDNEAAPDPEDHETTDHAGAEPAVAGPPGEPAGEDSPAWTVASSRPAGQEPETEAPPAQPPAAQETTTEQPVAEVPRVEKPVVEEPVAEPAVEEPAAEQPARGAPDPAAEGRSGDSAAAKPAPGRVEVTVVPGVARYHRSECILIRFLGDGDLETMTKQEAVDATLVACRACQPDQLED